MAGEKRLERYECGRTLKIFAGAWRFGKRIFENFGRGNRFRSRKNGFTSGSKLRKSSKDWCWQINNSWHANSQSIFPEDREQLQLVAAACLGCATFLTLLIYHSTDRLRVAVVTSDAQSILEFVVPATDARWKVETMVLPELSRTMAYTTCNTVNRLPRKELHLNPAVLERSEEKKPIHRAPET